MQKIFIIINDLMRMIILLKELVLRIFPGVFQTLKLFTFCVLC